jgi:hypothetical protein
VKPAVGEFHLRLDSGSGRDAPAVDSLGQIVQQGRLASARFAANDDDTALSGARVGQGSVKYLTLGTASEKHLFALLAGAYSEGVGYRGTASSADGGTTIAPP